MLLTNTFSVSIHLLAFFGEKFREKEIIFVFLAAKTNFDLISFIINLFNFKRMKKVFILIVGLFITQMVCAQYNEYIKLRAESGWPLDSNGNLPTITLTTVDGSVYTGTPYGQNSGINFHGPFPVPLVGYHITDNEYRHYLMYPYDVSNTMLGIYFVYCID